MKLGTPNPDVRHRVGALLWALLVLPLASCLELGSKKCADGLECPEGTRCAANESVCISVATTCGDGIVQSNEQCDDGNLRNGDGCSRDCKLEGCGNGSVDVALGEVCDDGNQQSGDGCSADCRSNEQCGNGVTDAAVGEVCDDGNRTGGDGCSADCRSLEQCGNGVTDFAAGEVCDDGNRIGGDGCSADCLSGESCGNGVRDVDEECDDKNNDNEDNCLNLGGKCVLARCGDGYTDKQPPGVEECDTAGESASCNFNCTVARCGDGIVNAHAGEQCDTQGESRTCNDNCTVARCGDGKVNLAAGEECDDGNTDNTDGCLNTCKINHCGDGHYDPATEACEDGNRDACGTCSATCQEYQFKTATGSIAAVAGILINDGETFSISDGIHLPTIFEFDMDDPEDVKPGRIAVPINSGMDARSVAKVIRTVINQTPYLNIDAELPASPSSTVNLTNVPTPDHPDQLGAGVLGNQRIITTVGNAAFKVTGMSGGGSRDCPVNTPCLFGQDCVSGRCVNYKCAE